jgi:hypothetical protein
MTTTTILGIPGTGKSSYCKIKSAEEGVTWRPEPTDDVDQLGQLVADSYDEVNRIILDRFLTIDCVTHHAYRDSDYWTAKFIFGGESSLNPFLAPVSEKLIWVRVSPERQIENIVKRGRSFWRQELQYTQSFWHDRALEAFQKHPAAQKVIIEPTSEPFTWKQVE